LDNTTLVQKVRHAKKLLDRAKECYDESKSLIEEAFNVIIEAVITEGDSPFRKARAIEHRRLAIQGLALAINSLKDDRIAGFLEQALNETYSMLVFTSETRRAEETPDIIRKIAS